MHFTDVPVGYWAYGYIEWAYCGGIVSGYSDGTFRPDNYTTRSQIVKMVVLAAGWPLLNPAPNYTFSDVPTSQPFYLFVETAASHGIISGYNCGGLGEPCDGQNRPYFRLYNNVTRAQLSKMIVLAQGWGLVIPPSPSFTDVPSGYWAYAFIETAASYHLVGGYTCGEPGEPCDPQNRPYFRPDANATRAQLCKMLFQAYDFRRHHPDREKQ